MLQPQKQRRNRKMQPLKKIRILQMVMRQIQIIQQCRTAIKVLHQIILECLHLKTQVQRNLVLLEVRVVTVDLEAAAQMQDLEIMYMDRIPREK